jgi:thiamine biosynthesis lipoprotein
MSGFPVQRALLSATVFAADCSTADAWATAFMAMGHEKAIPLLNEHPELSVLLVYSSDDGIRTFLSESLKGSVVLEP